MSTDGNTDKYDRVYITTANCDELRAKTINATTATCNTFQGAMRLVNPTPTGGTLKTMFSCVEGEVGIVSIHQSSFTSTGSGAVYAYSYLNSTGSVYLLYRTGTSVSISFSGANLQGNNGNLSLLWRKMRLN